MTPTPNFVFLRPLPAPAPPPLAGLMYAQEELQKKIVESSAKVEEEANVLQRPAKKISTKSFIH